MSKFKKTLVLLKTAITYILVFDCLNFSPIKLKKKLIYHTTELLFKYHNEKICFSYKTSHSL